MVRFDGVHAVLSADAGLLVMVALWNRAHHYIFILSFVLLSFFFLFFLA